MLIKTTIKHFLFINLLTVLALQASAQITTQQARPVDSALVAEYLDEGNFHTTNYHGVTFPPGGYWTWDAGCGLYAAIDDYFLAWSHTGMVADTLAACIDTMPGQAYRLFNLDSMANTDDYRDSVELWLGSLGIPVRVDEIMVNRLKVFPNPVYNNCKVQIVLPQTGNYKLLIQTFDGKTVDVLHGFTTGKVIAIEVQHLKKGLYIFNLIMNAKRFTAVVVKI